MPSILILENYRQTLSVARSLHRAGYEVHAGFPVDAHRTAYDDAVAASSAVSHHFEYPSLFSPQFADVLADYCEAHEIAAIFPAGEVSIPVLEEHASRLPPVAAADPALVRVCIDKSRMNQKVLQAGLSLPLTREARSPEDLADAIEQIGLPCVVKPVDGLDVTLLGQKSLILRNRRLTREQVAEIGDTPVLVQQFISGRRHNCMFIARKGKITTYFEAEVLRTTGYPENTGYGTLVHSVAPTPHLEEQVRHLAGMLEYDGPGCVQFLVDGDRQGFLECNPRLDANVALAVHCGVDFPRLIIEHALGVEDSGFGPWQYPVGERLHWWLGDIESGLKSAATRQLGLAGFCRWQLQAVVDAMRAQRGTIRDPRDPAPARKLTRHLWSAARRRVTGKIQPPLGKGSI